jgi:hypothetical protein
LIFADERQRVQIDTELLIAAFFGYRPYTIFNIRVKLDNSKNKNLAKPATVLITERADIGKQYSGDVSINNIYDTKSSGNNIIIVI